MTINPILAIIAVIVFVAGVVGSGLVNILFFLRFKKACPEMYKTKSIVWKDARIIQDALNRLNDKSLSRLYRLSRQVPVLSVIAFGALVILIIVTAR